MPYALFGHLRSGSSVTPGSTLFKGTFPPHAPGTKKKSHGSFPGSLRVPQVHKKERWASTP